MENPDIWSEIDPEKDSPYEVFYKTLETISSEKETWVTWYTEDDNEHEKMFQDRPEAFQFLQELFKNNVSLKIKVAPNV